MLVKTTHDGSRNATVQVVCDNWIAEQFKVIDPSRLIGTPRHLKIDAIHYVVSDGVEVRVAWETDNEIHEVLPLSGRGKMDFESSGGLHATTSEDNVGISVRTIGLKPDAGQCLFTLIFDLSKHVGDR